jgi:hypothetical protein
VAAMKKEPEKQAGAAPKRRWFSSQVKALVVTALLAVILLVAAVPWYLSTPGMMSRVVAGWGRFVSTAFA